MRKIYFNKAGPDADHSRKSLRGGISSMFGQVGNVVIQIGSTIILARILAPEDFGLVAMVFALTGFASIFIDLGTRDAVIQRGEVAEGEANALFWITFGVALAFTLVICFCSGLIASFYGEPRLQPVAIALSLTFLLPGLYFQQYALMRRAMMFQKLAMIDLSANLLSTVVAIFLAYQGYGYWALVWKAVLSTAFTGVSVWIACGWWPGRPDFTSGVKSMLGFGLNVTAFTITDYFARSMDRAALGYSVGPRELGYYQNAFTVYDNCITVCSLHNVATASLSKLREDIPALKHAWANALSTLVWFAAPAFAVLAVVGQDLVVVLLGAKWVAAGSLLVVFALRGPAHVVERTHSWLHVACGTPHRWRHWGLLNVAAMIVALACGLPFGTFGIATAYAVATTLLCIPAVAYSGAPIGIRATDVLRAVGPQVVAAFAAAALAMLARHALLQDAPALLRLVILGVLCSGAYLAIVTLVFRVTKPLRLALSLLRNRGRGAAGPPT